MAALQCADAEMRGVVREAATAAIGVMTGRFQQTLAAELVAQASRSRLRIVLHSVFKEGK